MALLHGLQGMSASETVFALRSLDRKTRNVSDHSSAQGSHWSVPCFLPFSSQGCREIKLSPEQPGIWREACGRTGLGVAASVAWGLSCGHRLPLGSDNSLAKLQLPAWVSAQPWSGCLQQGRTFSPSGRWSARTPRVLQRRLYWQVGGEKKIERPWGFPCCSLEHLSCPLRVSCVGHC